MRRISVHALSAVTFASAIALAAPASAGSTDYLLKPGGVDGDTKAESQDDKHKNQIEILSYSWGETRNADALTDGLLVVRSNSEPAQTASKTKKVESIGIKQSTHAASGGGHGAGKVVVHDVSVAP